MVLPTPNSSVAGYLVPQASGPQPLEGTALEDFLHDLVAGVTGLAGELVRPRWQPEPDQIPAAATAWVAFGFTRRPIQQFPEIRHDGAANSGEGADIAHIQEVIEMALSFYDLGAGGLADKYCALMRDGVFIAQNREALQRAGFDVREVGSPIPAPVVLKQRWLYRVDLSVTILRQIDRQYAVLNLLKGKGTITGQEAEADPINVPFETPDPPP